MIRYFLISLLFFTNVFGQERKSWKVENKKVENVSTQTTVIRHNRSEPEKPDFNKALSRFKEIQACLEDLKTAENCLMPFFNKDISPWKKNRYIGFLLQNPQMKLLKNCPHVSAFCFVTTKNSIQRTGYIIFNTQYQIYKISM